MSNRIEGLTTLQSSGIQLFVGPAVSGIVTEVGSVGSDFQLVSEQGIRAAIAALAPSGGAAVIGTKTGTGQGLTITVPANTLNADGESLFIFGIWSHGQNGANTFTMKFGGVTFASIVISAFEGGLFWGSIHRSGSSAQEAGGFLTSGTIQQSKQSNQTRDLTVDQDIVVTWAAFHEMRALVVVKF